MAKKPTSLRIPEHLDAPIDKYIMENDVSYYTQGIIELIEKGLKYDQNLDLSKMDTRDHEIENLLQLSAFLTIKEWEARDNNGYAVLKEEQIKRIQEFIKSFNDLVHNVSIWREKFKDEGYTNLVEVVERSRQFM